MTAPAVTELELSAYVDGELARERRAAVEAWIASSPAAARRVAAWRCQNELLRARYVRAFAPVPSRPARPFRNTPARDLPPLRRDAPARRGGIALICFGSFCAGAAAALGAVTLLGLAPRFLDGVRVLSGQTIEARLVADPARTLTERGVTLHHAFAFDATKPVEFPASQADMAAQVSRRAGFSVRPPDLAANGFRLLGARVVPTETGMAAYLVYETREGERLGLSIARAGGLAIDEPRFVEGPVTIALWTQGDQALALSGRGGREAIEPLAARIRARTPF